MKYFNIKLRNLTTGKEAVIKHVSESETKSKLAFITGNAGLALKIVTQKSHAGTYLNAQLDQFRLNVKQVTA